MRIAVISDLHLGANPRACHFGHEENRFLRFLDFLERRHEAIVLLGDIFQAHHGPSLCRRHQKHQVVRIRNRFHRLSARFRSPGYHLVHGNHDEILGGAEGWASQAVFRRGDFGVYCLHGHQFDPVLRSFGPLARFSTWLAGRMRLLGTGGVEAACHWLDVVTQNPCLRPGRGHYARGAKKLVAAESVQVVVMGHTHVPTVHRIGGAWLANSGTCTGGRFSWVSVDMKEREVRLGQPESFFAFAGY